MPAFAKWLPDVFDDNAAVAGDAYGVLPGVNSYRPWPLPVIFSEALNSQCLGATMVYDAAGALQIFAGTATKLYKYAGPTVAWTDVTRVAGDYAVAAGNLWSFTKFGANLIAVNSSDAPQTIAIAAGANFAALGGSPPTAGFVQAIGDQVVMAGLSSTTNRLQWSAINDSAYWTANQRSSDYQDFPDGGTVRAVTDLQAGLVFLDNAIYRIVQVPDRSVFNFAKIEGNRGILAPSSLVTVGSRSFYLSEDGFFMTDALGASAPIGRDAVDTWFQGQVDYDHVYETIGAADPLRERIFWLFVGTDGNVVLCYDIALNAWSYVQVDADYIFSAATTGYTADNIETLLTALGYTLETVPFSFDARFLTASAPYLAMFDDAFKMNFFSGNNMAARVETGDFQPIPTGRAFVRGIRPLTDATNVKMSIGVKERAQNALSYGSERTVNSEGVTPHRASGRWFRVRATVDEAETWSHLSGIDIDAVPDGER